MSGTVKVRYVGAISPIDVPLARLANVANGDVVEVAAEDADGLLAQTDNWVAAKSTTKSASDDKTGA